MKTQRQRISENRRRNSRRNSRSTSLVNRRGNSEFIPIDLLIEILSRLPAKFIARCRCVSKLWGSIISSQVFTDLVMSLMTRSVTTRPQLLLACEKDSEVNFYSSPQPQNPNEKSSPIVASYHMNFPLSRKDCVLQSVHGLICLKHIRIVKGGEETVLEICNPSTGQSLTLPRVETKRVDVMSFLGYDPVGKQFKLLAMSKTERNGVSEEHQILTLGNGKLSWRMIECNIPHLPLSGEICINGVLYYRAAFKGFEWKFTIICFDISCEKFKLIEEDDNVVRGKLVNYKGKLAALTSDKYCRDITVRSRTFELRVLEDAEKHEWSTHTYVLPPSLTDMVPPCGMYIKGVTRTDEIVLFPYYLSNPLYLLYYSLERNTITKVEIQGIDLSDHPEVHLFIDHAEDVKLGGVFKTA